MVWYGGSMKKKHTNKTRILVVQGVTALLVGVSLFLQYTSKTHEDIRAVRIELSREISDVRQLLTENLLTLPRQVGELKGQSHAHATDGED